MKRLLDLDPAGTGSLRYISRLDREVHLLFGSSLPELPRGDEVEEGGKKIFVEFPQNFGILLRDFLQAAYNASFGSASPDIRGDQAYQSFREALIHFFVEAVLQERRNGLYNLLCLSLSKVFADAVCDFCSRSGRRIHHRFQLHREFSPFLKEVQETAWKKAEEIEPGSVRFRLGPDFNPSLVRTILEDQLPLVTTEEEAVRVQDLLEGGNSRFPLSWKGYREIYGILLARLRRALEKRESDWIRELQVFAGLDVPVQEIYLSKLLNDPQVIRFLFLDPGGAGKRIEAVRSKYAGEISYAGLSRVMVDLLFALKRNECVQILKREIEILSDRNAASAESWYSAGSLYRYGKKDRIVNEVREVTTVFLDLRGFTKKSEEAISAGELTDQLYAIFDPITSIVAELNGRIDKFTGDGMMITFGVDSRTREDPLNALRMSIRVQMAMHSLRAKKKTDFNMGISIHSGTAFVAHFMAGEDRVDRTVIGRNINIAGRLSSAGDVKRFEREKEEFEGLVESLSRSLKNEEERHRFLKTVDSGKKIGKGVSGVSVDAWGNLYNLGIVLTQQTLRALDEVVRLQSGEDGDARYRFYYDSLLSRQVSLYYVGDVKFKGVESAMPVYAVLL